MRDLQTIFVSVLREMFDGENQLVQGLSELQLCANSLKVKMAFRVHLAQTRKHVQRLEQVFEEIRESVDRRPCSAIEGIIDEAQWLVMEYCKSSALDAALIATAQKAEHYEISTYKNLYRWARELGYERAAELLEANLSEEVQTDKLLTVLAEWALNKQAKRHDTRKEPESEAALGKALAFGH